MLQHISVFDEAAILIVLAAVLGYLNHRVFRLPASIGLTVMGAVASLLVVAADRLFPEAQLSTTLTRFLQSIDFETALMDGMLSFLLFAGALHVDWAEMRRGRWQILGLSTVGVMVSTAIIGGGFFLISGWLGLQVPLLWCLVFGALISPTDPVAVMAVLKRASVPPSLQATVAGESLFNDGVGVVVYGILLAAAAGTAPFEAGEAAIEFAREAGGGMRGGISIALALALPAGDLRTIVLATTYVVVLFSVIVQGGSIGWLIQRLGVRPSPSAH
jgi:CPA1 family monovalent cation:H+ antiporter